MRNFTDVFTLPTNLMRGITRLAWYASLSMIIYHSTTIYGVASHFERTCLEFSHNGVGPTIRISDIGKGLFRANVVYGSSSLEDISTPTHLLPMRNMMVTQGLIQNGTHLRGVSIQGEYEHCTLNEDSNINHRVFRCNVTDNYVKVDIIGPDLIAKTLSLHRILKAESIRFTYAENEQSNTIGGYVTLVLPKLNGIAFAETTDDVSYWNVKSTYSSCRR